LHDISIGTLSALLIFLIALSAFFSASETAMMALNRYRLRHLADAGHRGARLAKKLLDEPDRLLGTILLGNNAANLTASAVATVLALRLYGEPAIAIATFFLTLVVLIFAEVAPKTMAVLHPERVAFPAAYVLTALLRLLSPVVWVVNWTANRMLKLAGTSITGRSDSLSADELRVAVLESGARIPPQHQSMLLRILELENMTVDDVMLPRAEIEAVNLEDDWELIVQQLATSHHSRLPVYAGTLDNIVGILHLRKVLHLSQTGEFNRDNLKRLIRDPYFIPEGSRITQQLLNLQRERRRFGLVVDEYGDLKGLVTVEEILEEIVGEFTANVPGLDAGTHPQADGSYLVRGSANVRELNRKLDWNLPMDGPKTINGLVLEYLESIPESGTSLILGEYLVEIMQTRGAAVSVAKIKPRDLVTSAAS